MAKKVTKINNKQAQIDELNAKIESAIKDRDNKLEASRKQLSDMLDITADKYLTATGVAEALRVWRFVINDEKNNAARDLRFASKLARNMADQVNKMADKARKLDNSEMDSLCEGFYNPDFANDLEYVDNEQLFDMAFQMMCIDLCRNVGSAAEDILSFYNRSNEELEAMNTKLKELESGE